MIRYRIFYKDIDFYYVLQGLQISPWGGIFVNMTGYEQVENYIKREKFNYIIPSGIDKVITRSGYKFNHEIKTDIKIYEMNKISIENKDYDIDDYKFNQEENCIDIYVDRVFWEKNIKSHSKEDLLALRQKYDKMKEDYEKDILQKSKQEEIKKEIETEVKENVIDKKWWQFWR